MGTRKDPKTGKYRPLPYYLKIKESDIEGHGLFTTVRLKSGKYIITIRDYSVYNIAYI